MKFNQYTFEHLANYAAYEELFNFLNQLRDELYLADETAVYDVLERCYQRGGFLAGYAQGELCAVLGYLLGEPKKGYVNREVALLYVAGILKPYRRTGLFLQGLRFSLELLNEMDVCEIRLQAEAANPYTNRLYGRFAQPLGPARSLNDKEVITYGASVKQALASLELGKEPLAHPRPTQKPHHMDPLRHN